MPGFVPYRPERVSDDQMRARADEFFRTMDRRRSVRQFSAEPVPRDVIARLIQQGLVQRTPRGRVLGDRAYAHLGLAVPANRPGQLDLLPDDEVAVD